MNPEQLLAHFDRIGDAPDAIPRLRRFILDLAVHGKLIAQDSSDEPASQVLARIYVEPKRIMRIRARENCEGVASTDDESLFELPQGWEWTRFGRLPIQASVGIDRGRFMQGPDKEFAYFRMNNIRNSGGTDLSNLTRIDATSDEVERFALADGDFLFNTRNSRELVGKTCVFRSTSDDVILYNNNILRVKFVVGISPDFLDFWFRSHAGNVQLEKLKSNTTNVCAIYQGKLVGFPCPLPPLAEQRRIVAKVDELMVLCDRLEAAQNEREACRTRLAAASLTRLNQPADDAPTFREHVQFHLTHLPRFTTRPDQIRDLRQTILNLAVRGKLVAQDQRDAPASTLLASEYPESAGPIPENWQWVRIVDLLIGDSQNGYSRKPDDSPDGTPILRISAGTVRRDGLVAEEEHKLISGISPEVRVKFGLIPGDLLACRFNGNRAFVGRLTLFADYLNLNPIYPDKLIRLRLSPELALSKLVRCFAESSDVRREIESYCATTVGNWGISASNLKQVRIPLPPLAEQHRIVAKVEELLTLCDRLETQLTTCHTESRRLLEATLHQALAPALENAV